MPQAFLAAATKRRHGRGGLTSGSVWICMFNYFGTGTTCETADVLSFQTPVALKGTRPSVRPAESPPYSAVGDDAYKPLFLNGACY